MLFYLAHDEASLASNLSIMGVNTYTPTTGSGVQDEPRRINIPRHIPHYPMSLKANVAAVKGGEDGGAEGRSSSQDADYHTLSPLQERRRSRFCAVVLCGRLHPYTTTTDYRMVDPTLPLWIAVFIVGAIPRGLRPRQDWLTLLCLTDHLYHYEYPLRSSHVVLLYYVDSFAYSYSKQIPFRFISILAAS
ncbi:hypothetical protein CYLTODRAFT_413756 [Cylindrobasidium torrendii FP15055 ss-10]|uniref:Uncharacterized protein n=1 Tax=Cylindrobasidium torrendii FP15055 ss-10 TaxID=1314674 RepID=A0A0D7B0T4_9AGAR|nr:hypothetical protein CYLTODRAFT_413756 [Cylindrobasidium torrendii FP15055 ss-10]